MNRPVVFVIVLAIIAVVLGALLWIGVVRGDDTDVDKNGVDGAPVSLAD